MEGASVPDRPLLAFFGLFFPALAERPVSFLPPPIRSMHQGIPPLYSAQYQEDFSSGFCFLSKTIFARSSPLTISFRSHPFSKSLGPPQTAGNPLVQSVLESSINRIFFFLTPQMFTLSVGVFFFFHPPPGIAVFIWFCSWHSGYPGFKQPVQHRFFGGTISRFV